MEPYRHFASIYDYVMDTVPYDEWVAFVVSRLAQDQRPRRILDACCGTGNVSVRLARAGFRVVGVDRSLSMLQMAEEKGRRLVEGGEVPPHALAWVCQDVRALRLEQPVDAAVCLYDSLNYLLTPEDLQQALNAMAGAVRPGGLLVFDVYQRWDPDQQVPPKQIIQGAGWSLIWENDFDRRTRHWRTNLKGVLREGHRRHRFTEEHVERAYSLAQVRKALAGAGLREVRAFDGFADHPADRYTTRVVYQARKPAWAEQRKPKPRCRGFGQETME